MSDNDDNDPKDDLDELEWDDALADWEDEIDDAAQAKSAPMPQTTDAPASRPLYRPPSPDDTFARRSPAPRAPTPSPSKLRDDFPGLADDDDDEERNESTRIAQIPKELIASLVEGERRGNEHPTRPPAPPAAKAGASAPASAPKASPPPVDLDFDGLLDGMDEETRAYGEALPASPKVGGAAEATAPRPRPGSEPPLPKTRIASSPLLDSEPPPPTRVASSPLLDSEPPPPTRVASSPLSTFDVDEPDELPKTRIAQPPSGPPAAKPPSRVPPPPPRPRVPPPGASAASLPKPPLPSIPRPAVPRPGIPAPAGAKPAVPRPPLPSIPRPGQAKLDVPKPPGFREPSGVKGPVRPPEPAKPAADDALALLATPVPPAPKAATPAPPPRDAVATAELESDVVTAELEPPSSDAFEVDDDDDAVLLSSVPATALAPVEPEPPEEPPARDSGEVAAELGLGEPLAAADDELDALLGLDAEEPEPAAEETGRPSIEVEVEAASETELETEAEIEAETETEAEAEIEAEAQDDDEGVEAETVGDDDDDLVFESSEDEGDDEDWDDEDWEAIEAAEAAQAAQEPDRGALAARRSVRSRKPREESFPMIGDGAEALRLRQRLMTTLAASKSGSVKARLLVAAAELCEQIGEADQARDRYREAVDADPNDVVAIRALRRDALARGAWDDLAELFAREAQLALSPLERALALIGLAEVHLSRRGDAAAAEKASARALELEPRSLSARLLLTEARFAQGRAADALAALGPAAEGWDDPAARAAVRVELARHAEREGDLASAREHYRAAAELDERAFDALLGVARTGSRPDADPAVAVAALARVAGSTSGALREALLTRASRVATLVGDDPKTGFALLADATGVLPLQARADAAGATGDRAMQLAALRAWASAAGGTDRALALVRTAEALAADGDLDGAEASLRDAALADGSLGTIRLVREVIARRTGDMSRLVDAVAGGALSASARLAATAGGLDQERELLETAATEGNALVAADVLTLDVAAGQQDLDAVDAALRRQADRVPPEQRTGSLLALAERAVERGDLDAADAILSDARTLATGDPLVLRPLGRLALRKDAIAAAALWLEESSVASGERAAYAATEAGRVLARAGGDAVGALRRALDAVPGYGPAAWLLKPLATELGDPLVLGEVHEQLATATTDPTDRAGHLVRGALLRAEADPEGAAALLERARTAVPTDAVLQGLVMRATATSPLGRAAMLVESAESAPPLLARVFRLQAAAAYEDAGEPALAAAQYRAVAEETPEDAIVKSALDRAEIAAGEIARVAERRMAAVKDATDDSRRVHALERLADLDQHERKDPASAVLSLMSILETAPGHLPSLRALQRYFAEQKRPDDAVPILAAMSEHLEAGPDVTSHVRLARRLMLANADAPGEAADELLVSSASRAELDLWLAPRVLAAARARGDQAVALTSARKLAELLASADERASARVRAAELARATDPEGALALLREAVHAAPMHPLAADALARTCELADRWEEAAEAWETAARASEVRARAAALFYRAGRIWAERANDPERAQKALEQACERDVTHADVFDRLRELLEQKGDRERLAELFGTRLAAGGETAQIVELYVLQAKLYTDLRELEHAKSALRAALALMPERLDALRSLANLCLEDEDWRGAAEVLIRIARIRKEREELRWVFFTLGDIYDRHMPDPRRAEAAFQRVLKLLPQDVPAMERLAGLYEREGQAQKAGEILAELARVDVDPERNRVHRLKLAESFEKLGDARRAEQVLDEARKNAPTDLAVLQAMVQLYQRQNAGNAMAMHLNRAVNDFRHALEADLGDAAAWPGLVEVLTWRGDSDAASAAASAAQALGIMDVEMSKLVDARGAAPGLGGAAAAEILDELIAPVELSAPTRAVFKLAGDALEKSLPFDVAAYRAEKVNPRDTSIRPLALEVGRWFGVPDPQLYVTSAAPRVCVPVYSDPVTLLIGSELLGITDDREKVFVLVRAFKIAHAQLSVVVRAQPQEVVALVGGLVQSYDPRHEPAGVDPALVGEAARRIVKNVSKRAQSELGPLVFEMAGRPGYDPARFAMAASEWGNRVALLASGSAPAAFSALAKLSGERELPSDPSARLAMLSRFPEATSLLAFAVSDACFEARKRARR